jgi:hypothetical protein
MQEQTTSEAEAQRLEDAMIGSNLVRCLVQDALDAEAQSLRHVADHAWRRVNRAVAEYERGR